MGRPHLRHTAADRRSPVIPGMQHPPVVAAPPLVSAHCTPYPIAHGSPSFHHRILHYSVLQRPQADVSRTSTPFQQLPRSRSCLRTSSHRPTLISFAPARPHIATYASLEAPRRYMNPADRSSRRYRYAHPARRAQKRTNHVALRSKSPLENRSLPATHLGQG